MFEYFIIFVRHTKTNYASHRFDKSFDILNLSLFLHNSPLYTAGFLVTFKIMYLYVSLKAVKVVIVYFV